MILNTFDCLKFSYLVHLGSKFLVSLLDKSWKTAQPKHTDGLLFQQFFCFNGIS